MLDARQPARGARAGCLLVQVAALLASTSATVERVSVGTGFVPINYAEWPPPLTELSRATTLALRMGEPGAFTGGGVVRRLLELAQARAMRGQPPPVLVKAGGEWPYGIGNFAAAIASAAMTAEAVGGACVFSLGALGYATKLRPRLLTQLGGLRLLAYPCVEVGLDDIGALLAQRDVAVLHEASWRTGGTDGPDDGRGGPERLWQRVAADAAVVIDMGDNYHEANCATRLDIGHLIAPPGISPAAFWARYRSKFEELFRLAIAVPHAPIERLISSPLGTATTGAGTFCAHLRLLHKENHHVGGSTSCDDCGLVLSALEAMYARRKCARYLIASGANCTHCLPLRAPRLFAGALRLENAHFSTRVAGESFKFDDDDPVGVVADVRALSRCSVVVVDDKFKGTFAMSAAAAGRLAPCADVLAWLEEDRPVPGAAYALRPRLAGSVDWAQFAQYPYPERYLPSAGHAMPAEPIGLQVRSLCKTSSPAAPALEIPPLSAEQLRRVADDVRVDITRPWRPRALPRLYTPGIARGNNSVCVLIAKARFKRLQRYAKAQRSERPDMAYLIAAKRRKPARAGKPKRRPAQKRASD